MSYLALYRQYRPIGFDGVIGQEHIVKTLSNQVKTGRFGHAYLFTGTRGTGKTSVAKIFARAINCLSPVDGSPCGKCSACLALKSPSNIDVIEIDAASNNGVNEIRDIREKVQYPPVNCKYKVYIIDEVHMLSGAAFNALLKTLEEPPAHAVFILATTEAHKIPATILSRCMRFDFRLIPTEKIAEHIENIFREQGKDFEKEAVYAIALAGEGSLRDALSIADTALSFGEGKLTYSQVTDLLGATESAAICDLLDAVIAGDIGGALDLIAVLSDKGKSMGVLAKDLTETVRSVLIAKTCKDAEGLLKVPEEKFIRLSKTAQSATTDRLLRILGIYADTETALRYSTHPKILFETAAVKAARPDADYDYDALLARIKELETTLKEVKEKGVIVKTAPVSAPENKVEEKPEPRKETIAAAGTDRVKGTLLAGLRQGGSEMLWNIMQSVGCAVSGDKLVLSARDEGDFAILDKPEMKAAITDALSTFAPFTLEIKVARTGAGNEMEEGVERFKRMFGDNIVITK